MTFDDDLRPPPRRARYLFLGGSRHHQWIEMNTEDTPAGPVRPVKPEMEFLAGEVYHARRCESGPKVWWVYILAGHAPRRSDIVDAYPYLT